LISFVILIIVSPMTSIHQGADLGGSGSELVLTTLAEASHVRYAVTLVCPPGYAHNLALLEIAETLYYAMVSLGLDAMLTDKLDEPGRRHIVLGAHLLSSFGLGPLKPDSIIYNFEQIDPASPWIEVAYLNLLRKHEVWDYSTTNIELLKLQGLISVHHLPLGYVKNLERITPVAQDIDVLFYGSINPRRQLVLDELKATGLNVKQIFGYYGIPRDELIARSKIVLNIHYYESKIFEVARVSYLLTNGVCIVSEVGPDPVEQDYAGALAFAAYEDLTATCVALINDPGRRSDIAKVGQFFMRGLPQEKFILTVLESSKNFKRPDVQPPPMQF